MKIRFQGNNRWQTWNVLTPETDPESATAYTQILKWAMEMGPNSWAGIVEVDWGDRIETYDFSDIVRETYEALDEPSPRDDCVSVAQSNLHSLLLEAYETAVEKGFHDTPLDVPTKIALIHSELSEALEAHRKGVETDDKIHADAVLTELADVMIRTMDLMVAWERGLVEHNPNCLGAISAQIIRMKMDYNKTRTPKHGKKY